MPQACLGVSNEQDLEENMADSGHLEGKILCMVPAGATLVGSDLRSYKSSESQHTQNEVDSGAERRW